MFWWLMKKNDCELVEWPLICRYLYQHRWMGVQMSPLTTENSHFLRPGPGPGPQEAALNSWEVIRQGQYLDVCPTIYECPVPATTPARLSSLDSENHSHGSPSSFWSKRHKIEVLLPVAYITKEFNLRLAKRQMKTNGRLADHELINLSKKPTGVLC